jgi:hypothetical protein
VTVAEEDETAPLENPVEEGRRVVEDADDRDLVVRTIGGTAIDEKCETMQEEPFEREYRDVDFVTTREYESHVTTLMTDLGYEENKRLNTMHRYRMEFFDPVNERKADYIIDKFRFSHSWGLRDRVERDHPTMPIEDLLLSKLQIAEISDRDVRDVIAMMNDHPIATEPDEDAIDASYVADLCRRDWGLYKTTTMNLERVEEYLRNHDLPIDQSRLQDRATTLYNAIEEEPKTIRWKLRSLLGERKQWYKRPELS